jgi:hypothetical protein
MKEGSQVASAHVDRRGRALIALVAAAGASAVLVCAAPAFAADPTPDPPPTNTAPTPDPPPSEPQPSPPEPAQAPSPSPPASSNSSPSSTQASGSVASSTANPDGRPAKRKHPKVVHRPGRSEVRLARKWQRARNHALAAALALPAVASEAVVVQATLSPRSSSAPFLPAALAAALATLLLAATPSYALHASRVFRPVAERRFELATIGVCILVGIAVANGLPTA